MQRYSFYKLIHKGIREVAHGLAARAGRTDFGDPGEVAALRRALDEAFAVFESHARHEARFVLPLLRRCSPQLAAESEADHHSQALRLRDLRSALALATRARDGVAERGHAFVLGLSRFEGEMLVHMADEEERQLPALWAAYDDATLRRMQDSLLASLSAEEKARTLSFVLPALSGPEQAELLEDVRAKSPARLRAVVDGVARRVLPAV